VARQGEEGRDCVESCSVASSAGTTQDRGCFSLKGTALDVGFWQTGGEVGEIGFS
jgi:hypothetical protein